MERRPSLLLTDKAASKQVRQRRSSPSANLDVALTLSIILLFLDRDLDFFSRGSQDLEREKRAFDSIYFICANSVCRNQRNSSSTHVIDSVLTLPLLRRSLRWWSGQFLIYGHDRLAIIHIFM